MENFFHGSIFIIKLAEIENQNCVLCAFLFQTGKHLFELSKCYYIVYFSSSYSVENAQNRHKFNLSISQTAYFICLIVCWYHTV